MIKVFFFEKLHNIYLFFQVILFVIWNSTRVFFTKFKLLICKIFLSPSSKMNLLKNFDGEVFKFFKGQLFNVFTTISHHKTLDQVIYTEIRIHNTLWRIMSLSKTWISYIDNSNYLI